MHHVKHNWRLVQFKISYLISDFSSEDEQALQLNLDAKDVIISNYPAPVGRFYHIKGRVKNLHPHTLTSDYIKMRLLIYFTRNKQNMLLYGHLRYKITKNLTLKLKRDH